MQDYLEAAEELEKCVLNFEKTQYTVNSDVKTATVSFVDGQSFERSVVIFFNEESEVSFSNKVKGGENHKHARDELSNIQVVTELPQEEEIID